MDIDKDDGRVAIESTQLLEAFEKRLDERIAVFKRAAKSDHNNAVQTALWCVLDCLRQAVNDSASNA